VAKMTSEEFDSRVSAMLKSRRIAPNTRQRTIPAARAVLVDGGMTWEQAGRVHHVDPGAAWRVGKRIQSMVLCRYCGQEVKS
jgi:hypothetical protein